MTGLWFKGNSESEIREFPKPVATEDMVVVKVKASAICGTDLPWFVAAPEGTLKCIPGHEIAGEVVEVGHPRYVRKGDRVIINTMVTCGHCDYCRHGQVLFCDSMLTMGLSPGLHGGDAEYTLAPERCCMPLPDDISYNAGAAIVDGVGVPYHVFGKMGGIKGGDTVAIFGAGPIGLGTVIMAKFLGATVILSEVNDYRLNLASKLGADYVINSKKENPLDIIKDITKGRGTDKAVDCAGGTEVTTSQALSSVKKGGKVGFVGQKYKATINPNEQIIWKEVEIVGSCGYNAGEYGGMIRMVQRGLAIESMITHQYALGEAPKAFKTFSEGNTGKVILNP